MSRHERQLRRLADALQFLDLVRDTPAHERAEGVMRDALQGLEAAAREVVATLAPPLVSLAERTPTEADTNARGDVVWLRSGVEVLGRLARGVPVDATHWRRVDP